MILAMAKLGDLAAHLLAGLVREAVMDAAERA